MSESELTIERGIDAIEFLRVEMRKAGMLECADTLDEAFAKCLRDYLARKPDAEGKPGLGKKGDGKKLN